MATGDLIQRSQALYGTPVPAGEKEETPWRQWLRRGLWSWTRASLRATSGGVGVAAQVGPDGLRFRRGDHPRAVDLAEVAEVPAGDEKEPVAEGQVGLVVAEQALDRLEAPAFTQAGFGSTDGAQRYTCFP